MHESVVGNHKIQNWILSVSLLIGMALLLGGMGYLLVDRIGFLVAMTLTFFLLLGASYPSHLVMRLAKARPLHPSQAPGLYNLLEMLSNKAGLRKVPLLYYLPSAELNAFASGRKNDAAIALTEGLVRYLNHREMAGVLAHELSHIRNNDIFVMNLANTTSRLTHHFALFGQILLFLNLPLIVFGGMSIPWVLIILLIVAPALSAMMQMALSRTREHNADLNAAEMTGDPRGLASALAKLENQALGFWARIFRPYSPSEQTPDWLRSHPDTKERIGRLLSYEKQSRETRASGWSTRDFFSRIPRRRVKIHSAPKSRVFPRLGGNHAGFWVNH